MKKDEIKKVLNCFREAVANDKVDINIMLLDQNNQRKKRYKGLMLKTKLEDIENVVEDSFDFLMEELDRRTLDIYDLEISVDESTQMVKREDVIHGEEILGEITVQYTEENVVSENTDLLLYRFLVRINRCICLRDMCSLLLHIKQVRSMYFQEVC